ncbi:MAG: hypothetical protein AAFU64_03470, partial [Bacteroidota bacterium]
MKLINFHWLLTAFLWAWPILVQAQREGDIWYFGNKAGLDFGTGSPVSLSDGAMNTNEGCSSISDQNGNLLFYTNGIQVWNRNHEVMSNGEGLLGHNSSTNSALIVPKPCDPYLYYVFAVAVSPTQAIDTLGGGVTYSIVDMRLNDGLGDIVKEWKNISLSEPTTEKLLAVPHANQRDVWILTRLRGSDEIHAFLLNPSGINQEPVRSKSPHYLENCFSRCADHGIGHMKASKNSDQIALARRYGRDPGIDLYDFDNHTGLLSHRFFLNAIELSGEFYPVYPYGLEFSASGRFLYYEDGARIFQLDLSLGDVESIAKQYVLIARGQETANYTTYYGSLLRGPDQMIYVARPGFSFLDVITKPDELGLACDYQRNRVDLGEQICRLGMVNLISNYDEARSNIPVEIGQIEAIIPNAIFCDGGTDSLVFSVEAPPEIDLFIWSLSPELRSVSGHLSTTEPQIVVRLLDEARQGSLSVYGLDTNNCTYVSSSKVYSFDLDQDSDTVAQIGPISPLSTFCSYSDSLVFTVEASPEIDVFVWNLSPELTPLSDTLRTTEPRISIRFSGDVLRGSISVQGLDTNNCAIAPISETYSFDLSQDIGPVGKVKGQPLVCEDQGILTYTTTLISQAESYSWTLPPGAFALDGATSTSQPVIQVVFDTSFRGGEIRVQGQNNCATTGLSFPFPLTLLPPPEPATIEQVSCNQLATEAVGNFYWSFQGEV